MAVEPLSISLKRRLNGKVAIVTGGASGIGEATARLFAKHGAKVVVADIQAEKGRQVANSIGSELCSFMYCDVVDEEQVKAMVDETIKKYGRLDVMFSNAGIMSPMGQSILGLDFSKYDRVMQVNTRGMAACVKYGGRAMKELGTRGSIVCTASVLGTMGAMNHTDYTISKHAVIGLMRAASIQLGAHGIRVNCVSPSAVPTPIVEKFGMTAEVMEEFVMPFTSLKGNPVESRLGNLAEAVLFLASDDSGFVTGQNLLVDGGLLCYPFPIGKQSNF